MSNIYEVEVFADADTLRLYIVHADDEAAALDIACEHVRDLIGGEVRPMPEEWDALDYDSVLGGKEDQ